MNICEVCIEVCFYVFLCVSVWFCTSVVDTEVPIDRNTLLQARQMAVRMEKGPPGLAMWGNLAGAAAMSSNGEHRGTGSSCCSC